MLLRLLHNVVRGALIPSGFVHGVAGSLCAQAGAHVLGTRRFRAAKMYLCVIALELPIPAPA